jgi:hypothetical protein
MLCTGIDIGRVMLAGDWERPEMPAYYDRKLAPDRSVVAEMVRLQQQNSEDYTVRANSKGMD